MLGTPKLLVRMDHQPLKALLTDKEATGRVARWIMKLQEFPYEVIYREGEKHVNADAMTRPPIALPPLKEPSKTLEPGTEHVSVVDEVCGVENRI